MPCVGKGTAGISLGILLCSIPILFVCLFVFPRDLQAQSPFIFCQMLHFPHQCPMTLGRQLMLGKGTSASLRLVTRVTPAEGTRSQSPSHQEFCVFLELRGKQMPPPDLLHHSHSSPAARGCGGKAWSHPRSIPSGSATSMG